MKARQRKKLRKNSIISFDMNSLPNGLDLDKWFRILNEEGLILWNSYNRGHKPEVFPKINARVFNIKSIVKVPEDWDSEKWIEGQKKRGVNFIENK